MSDYNIEDIAKLITEDPDIVDEQLLLEYVTDTPEGRQRALGQAKQGLANQPGAADRLARVAARKAPAAAPAPAAPAAAAKPRVQVKKNQFMQAVGNVKKSLQNSVGWTSALEKAVDDAFAKAGAPAAVRPAAAAAPAAAPDPEMQALQASASEGQADRAAKEAEWQRTVDAARGVQPAQPAQQSTAAPGTAEWFGESRRMTSPQKRRMGAY